MPDLIIDNSDEPIEIHKRWNGVTRKFEDIDCWPKWISIKSQLPEPYTTIIATDGIFTLPSFYNIEHKLWLGWTGWKHLNLIDFTPTYWTPLPESSGENK